MTGIPDKCPDGGSCHHGCISGCFRVVHCDPLDNIFPGDRWPAGVIEAYSDLKHTDEVTEAVVGNADGLTQKAIEAFTQGLEETARVLDDHINAALERGLTALGAQERERLAALLVEYPTRFTSVLDIADWIRAGGREEGL